MESNTAYTSYSRPIFIARQPIYDRQLQVMGYELLFRARDTDRAEITNGKDASSLVIIHGFINIGIDNLVGSALAFINIPEELFVNDTLLPMFHEHTVLEVLEDVAPTPEVLAGLQRLKQRGFRVALDDFIYTQSSKLLIEMADYVKVDVLVHAENELASLVKTLREFPVRLIAEKVESSAMYDHCMALGFDGFQGYFFQAPKTVTQSSLPANKAVVLQILQQLAEPELDIRRLESLLANDVALSYKLLRYVNSAAFGQRREIKSLGDAIALVGARTISQWATLILLDSVNLGKPQELIRMAMIRAHMAENLAGYLHPPIQSFMFITGLLSVLDVLMEMPMEVLLDNLTLSPAIRFALLNYEGDAGTILRDVVDYEAGNWQALLSGGTDPELLTRCYLEGVQWADLNMLALFA